jgi:integrase/recombinase XerD
MPRRPRAPAGCFWKGATLYGRSRIKGRLHRWSLETDDPKVAAKRRKVGKDRLIGFKHGDAVRYLHDIIEDWTNDWLIPNKGAKTAKRYLCSLGQLAPYLDGKSLDEIDGKLIAEIIKARRLDGVSNATIKRDLGALSSVFNYAIDQGWCENNPVLPRLGRIEEKRHPIVLPSQADIELVMDRAPRIIRDMMRVAIAIGAREEELYLATSSQIDYQRHQMTLIGKGRNGVKKHRVVDLDPFDGYRLILALPPSPAKSSLLFWHHDGQQYSTFPQQFYRLVKQTAAWASKNGVLFRKFRFHDLRHLHAVNWLKDGKSIYDLQRRLGHSSIKTTEEYCRFLTAEEDRAVKGLAVSQKVSPGESSRTFEIAKMPMESA